MAFGIDTTGFTLKKHDDIKESIISTLRVAFGDGIRVDEKSNFGQLIDAFAEELAEVWELDQAAYNLVNPDAAYGVILDHVVQFAGLKRLAATKSTQDDQEIVGATGTVIPEGSVISQEGTGDRFVTLAEVTIPASGTITVDLEAEEAGPIEAKAGTLTKIETPVTGWDSTTNNTDADAGRARETDAELKLRWLKTLQRPGGTSALGILAELLNLQGVELARVIENELDETDADGRPTRSYEVLIKGGDDTEIAKTLWKNKPAGGQLMTTVADPNFKVEVEVDNAAGKKSTVEFARPVEVEIYVRVVISSSDLNSMPVEHSSSIEEAILEETKGYPIGLDVRGWRFSDKVTSNQWVEENTELIDSIDVYVGTGAVPATTDATILSNEIAVFDSTRITVEFV